MEHLTTVLHLLKTHQVKVNKKKCSLGCLAMKYLGHVVSAKGVEMDPNKVIVVLNWPTQRNLKEVQGFLGLTSYYCRFIKNYGRIAQPLTNLLKKEQAVEFRRTDEAQATFQ